MARLACLGVALLLAACGGGSGPDAPAPPSPTPAPTPTPTPGGSFARPPAEFLSAGEVNAVLARAVVEAQARSRPATIAVVDRVGNVLGVYQMTGAPPAISVPGVRGRGLQGFVNPTPGTPSPGPIIPSTLGAIAKALTGAYLSSSGNAFSTRTANMIVQTPFPPTATAFGLESGPLYGVQFSQLPCSDLNARLGDGAIGPKRSPLGFAADPGGFPLYKNGTVVGGVGVIADGIYGLDTEVTDIDRDLDDEAIALAGTRSLDAPVEVRAERVTVDGTILRYSDAAEGDLRSPATATAIPGGSGALVAVTGYSAGAVVAGTPYGTEASGIRPATAAEFNNSDAYLLTNGTGQARFPIRAGTDGAAAITPAEARAIMEEAFLVLTRARAQIRRPLDSRMQASVHLVDTNGVVLGQVRSPDAPIFGIDVSLQKARTAMFFSGAFAAQQLQNASPPAGAPFPFASRAQLASYVTRAQSFFGDPTAFTGRFAITARAVGNISRNRFPDGELSREPGPLAPADSAGDPFVAFNTGVQLDAVIDNIVQHVLFVLGAGPDTPRACTFLPDSPAGTKRVANGFQIFSGGVPVYRGSTLVGALGVSGDGIDQDDMVAFLGTSNGGSRAGGVGNAPVDIRSDRILVRVGGADLRLRYVNCPFNPFLDTSQQNVCQGL